MREPHPSPDASSQSIDGLPVVRRGYCQPLLADRVTDQNRRRLRLPFSPYAARLCATAAGVTASGSVLEESCQPTVVTLKTTSTSIPASINTVMMMPHAILLTPLLITSSDDTERTSLSASFSIGQRHTFRYRNQILQEERLSCKVQSVTRRTPRGADCFPRHRL